MILLFFLRDSTGLHRDPVNTGTRTAALRTFILFFWVMRHTTWSKVQLSAQVGQWNACIGLVLNWQRPWNKLGLKEFKRTWKLMAEKSGQEIHISVVRLACRGYILCFYLFIQSFQIWSASIKGAHSTIHNAWKPNSEPARCRPCFGAAHRYLQAGLWNCKGRWELLRAPMGTDSVIDQRNVLLIRRWLN